MGTLAEALVESDAVAAARAEGELREVVQMGQPQHSLRGRMNLADVPCVLVIVGDRPIRFRSIALLLDCVGPQR